MKQKFGLILGLLFVGHTQAATYTVTNLNDSGVGSLREAMNSLAENDTINFSDSLSAGSIALITALPQITTSGVTIVGNLDNLGRPIFAIDGATPNSGEGFNIAAANVTIQNLAIINFSSGYGIVLNASADYANINHCFLGIATDGTTAAGNMIGIYGNLGNTCLGFTIESCFISANSAGVSLFNAIYGGSFYNNKIGVNFSQNAQLGNQDTGINLNSCSNIVIGKEIGGRNVISGNSTGINFQDVTNSTIAYNYIGTDFTGTTPIGNPNCGINITNSVVFNNNNQILYNVIAASNLTGFVRGSGISLNNSSATLSNITIANNYIGTDYTGNSGVGMGNTIGIFIFPGADQQISNVTITENVISQNENGVALLANSGFNLRSTITNLVITKNKIGVGADGITSLGNNSSGILLDGTCIGNMVGGVTEIDGNIIAYNGINNPGSGMILQNGASLNSILSNSIFGNSNNTDSQIVIDGTCNNSQSAPTLSSATVSADLFLLNISGTAPAVGSGADVPLIVQLFSTPSSFYATNPQGKIYLGSVTTTANASFDFQTLLTDTIDPVNTANYITAIATAINNSDAPGDSSPFSSFVPLIISPNSSGLNDFIKDLVTKYHSLT